VSVEDGLAIREVLARYCHTVDGADVDAWLDVFTADARWSADGFELNGRDEFREWFVGFRRQVPHDAQVHLTLNERVYVDGDEADAVSTFVTARAFEGLPGINSAGLYTDRLVRCEDGAWRIRTRTSKGSFRRTA
jgi:uncharacterized protein (TIGR02246 family)